MKGVWKKRNFLSTYPSLHCTNNLSVDVQSQKNVQAQIPYTSGPTLWIWSTKEAPPSNSIFRNPSFTLELMTKMCILLLWFYDVALIMCVGVGGESCLPWFCYVVLFLVPYVTRHRCCSQHISPLLVQRFGLYYHSNHNFHVMAENVLHNQQIVTCSRTK